MGFLDYVLAGFGVHEVKENVPQKRQATKNSTVTQKKADILKPKSVSPINANKGAKLAIFCPTTMAEVVEVVEFLRTNQPSMLNISLMDKSLAQRSMDYILGATTAIEATMQCIGNGLYVFVPKGTKVVNKLKENYD